MYKLFIIGIVIGVIVLSCNDNDTTDVFLQQPPFKLLTDSIKQQPGNAALYYKRGVLLYENNQLAYAEEDTRKAWNLDHQETYALGVAQVLAKKNTDSAIAFLQQAVQTLPNSIALKVSLATQLHQKGATNQALAICRQIIQQYPNQIDALLLQAQILKEQHKEEEALATLEKAYTYAPFDVELSYNLAFEYAQRKNPKAINLADSLLKMDSAGIHAEPYYFKGLYYESTGNIPLALQYLDQAIQHDYYFLDAYMEKGHILYNQKKYEQALKTFQLARTVSPTFADAYYWMGKCQEAMGDKTNAKLNYQRAYGLDKTLDEAKQAADRL